MEKGGQTHPTSLGTLRRDVPLFLAILYHEFPKYAIYKKAAPRSRPPESGRVQNYRGQRD